MEKKYNLAKWLDNQVSDEEIKSVEGFSTYQKIKAYSQDLVAPQLDEEKLFEKIEAQQQQKQAQPSSFSMLYKFAAALLLLIGLASFGFLFGAKEITAVSQVQEISLPDNSIVQVAANSTLNYNRSLWWLNRSLELSGKAYFEVEKGSTFSVHTTQGKVEVLGTKFEVDASQNELVVRCFEGKVKVKTPQQQDIITAYEAFETDEKQGFIKSNIQYSQPFWSTSQVKLVDADLKSIVDILEENFSVEIDISNIAEKKQFTGHLSTQNLAENFDIISTTYQFKIEQINKNSYIFVEDEGN